MKIALVGATGLVGREMMKVLAEQQFPVAELIPVASPASVGMPIVYGGKEYRVVDMETAIARKPQFALFSAGGGVSKEWAPRFAEAGAVVIDNSSQWRMHPDVPLVVPEVNARTAKGAGIIANPNCSTIQLVVALWPLHQAYGLRRVVVSTYQSVTGTGKAAVEQMMAERAGQPDVKQIYPHRIDLNAIPQVDVMLDDGYSKEEMKVMNESRKIMGLPELRITATTVRIPVVGGHSESVNIEFERPFDLAELRSTLASAPGLVVLDDPQRSIYPMPINAQGRDEVFVGRIRRDESIANGLNLWIVADNLRKGAATNAVQIAQALLHANTLA